MESAAMILGDLIKQGVVPIEKLRKHTGKRPLSSGWK